MFYSAIGVGLLWGVWHVKFAYGILGFILFVALMVCFSILMTWLYIKTKGNLLCMIVFHFGVNIGSVMAWRHRYIGRSKTVCSSHLRNYNIFIS